MLRDSAARVAATQNFTDYFLKQGIDPTDIIGKDADKMMADDDAMYAEFISKLSK